MRKTGALTAYITVDKPYENVIPGKRPPLLTNMYVEVELKGQTVPQQLVFPRSAVHDSRVFICNKDNRLESRQVKTGFHAGDLAVMGSGIEQGETLVLSDVVPAIEGMRLNPVVSDKDAQELKRQAMVAAKTGNEIRLGEIAEITDRFKSDDNKILFDGKRAGLLQVTKTKTEDALRIGVCLPGRDRGQ